MQDRLIRTGCLMLLCGFLVTSMAADELTFTGVPNPHRPNDKASEDIPMEPCSECHSIAAVDAKIHPMFELRPRGAAVAVPENFPLSVEGHMTCLTCHESHGKSQRSNRSFLRNGPYRAQLDFCFNCHPRDQYRRTNPHQQLRADGSVNPDVCLHCHAKAPSPDDHPTIAKAMNMDMSATCNKCHALHSHQQHHYGVNLDKAKRSIQRQVRATQRKYDLVLPLSERGEIQCHTCHYIHGSLGIDAVRFAGSNENAYFLRLPKEQLCYACHKL